MSSKKDEKPAPPPAPAAKESEAPKKGGLPIKTIGVVGTVMILEAVGIFMLMKAVKPKQAHGEVNPAQVVNAEGEKTVELKVVDDKFQNLQSGKVWLWDLSVFVVTKQKNKDLVEKRLAQRANEITEEFTRIVGKSQHAQLKEPERQTLNRQFSAVVSKLFEANEKGESPIERVIIPKCRGFPLE